MARAHSAATAGIDAADQQCLGFGACGRVIGPLAIEPGLDGVEEITVEDGWLLPSEDLALKEDLPNVEPIAQKMGERAAGERDPSDGLPGLESSQLCDDPPLVEVCHPAVEAPKLEIAWKHGSDPARLPLQSRRSCGPWSRIRAGPCRRPKAPCAWRRRSC